jgi:hypothetical protein
MIEAKVTAVVPGRMGRDPKAFACSPALVSAENPRGELMFYVAPPFWTAGRNPHPGQRVVVGSIERKLQPGWARPGWLAREVSPALAFEQFARSRLSEPTIMVSPRRPAGIWGRLLDAIGFKRQLTEQLG